MHKERKYNIKEYAKKVISILLVVVMAFLLASCSSNTENVIPPKNATKNVMPGHPLGNSL